MKRDFKLFLRCMALYASLHSFTMVKMRKIFNCIFSRLGCDLGQDRRGCPGWGRAWANVCGWSSESGPWPRPRLRLSVTVTFLTVAATTEANY